MHASTHRLAGPTKNEARRKDEEFQEKEKASDEVWELTKEGHQVLKTHQSTCVESATAPLPRSREQDVMEEK